ncbi:hypothetical protein X777_08192, partial [Ooceraea biroi]
IKKNATIVYKYTHFGTPAGQRDKYCACNSRLDSSRKMFRKRANNDMTTVSTMGSRNRTLVAGHVWMHFHISTSRHSQLTNLHNLKISGPPLFTCSCNSLSNTLSSFTAPQKFFTDTDSRLFASRM